MDKITPDVQMTLCSCGSVASVAAPHLLAWLRSIGIGNTNVVLSKAAGKFVTPDSLIPFTTGTVLEEGKLGHLTQPTHINIAEESDVVIVAPATANTIAKIAVGINDSIIP